MTWGVIVSKEFDNAIVPMFLIIVGIIIIFFYGACSLVLDIVRLISGHT